MKVFVVQLDGHHARQTHQSGCQHLTLFLQWPMWKILLQTAAQIVGRQQVVLHPLSIMHKCLWISSFIWKINMNTMFFWFTFMIYFTFSICRNSSGPPTPTAKKDFQFTDLFHLMFLLGCESCRWNWIVFTVHFFLKGSSADVKRSFRIMWQKLSNGYWECDDLYFTKLNYFFCYVKQCLFQKHWK